MSKLIWNGRRIAISTHIRWTLSRPEFKQTGVRREGVGRKYLIPAGVCPEHHVSVWCVGRLDQRVNQVYRPEVALNKLYGRIPVSDVKNFVGSGGQAVEELAKRVRDGHGV